MEYVTYILIIAGILVLCLILFRDPEQSLAREVKPKAAKPLSEAHALSSETLSVPIPWGWPGHYHHAPEKTRARPNAQEVHNVSETLHRFVDRLVSEKQTIESREYLSKKDASLRALLEDRYGRATAMKEKRDDRRKLNLHRTPKAALGSEDLGQLKTPRGW